MSIIFSIPTWLLSNSCSICFYKDKELLSLYPSWRCHQSLPVHFLLVSSVSSCVFICHFCTNSPALYMISVFAGECLQKLKRTYANCISSRDMLMVLTFMLMLVISSSLCVFFWDSQSTVYRSGLDALINMR